MASGDRDLEKLLDELIRDDSELALASVRDAQGSCPIHRAASMVNDPAVELLVTNYPSLALSQDNDGRTPLHLVVMEASSKNPAENEQTAFRRTIEELLTAMSTLKTFTDPKDRNGNTPWDYLDPKNDNHKWIARLKNQYRLVAMPTSDRKPRQLAPPDDDMKLKACRKSKATLAQFYLKQDGNTDYVDRRECSVFEVIYDKRYGPNNSFNRKLRRDPDRKPTCKWIHLPANNVS